MNLILFDQDPEIYFPLTLTRPVSYLRIGISTIKEKWERFFKSVSVKTSDYLTDKYPIELSNDNIWVSSKIIPSQSLITEISSLRKGEALSKEEKIIAFRNSTFDMSKLNIIDSNVFFNSVENLCDIFLLNGSEIKNDFNLIFPLKKQLKWAGDKERIEKILSENIKIGNNPIYIEEGAKLHHCILNTTDGPIYIGKNAEIMEGSMIRGPFAMLNNSVLKMGAKIYGATTIGPYCKVGGEVNNSVFFGFSSKAHDGFLGNSVIGEWCNLGADTNTSNLKNNYAEVKLWDYKKNIFKNTNLQFCGLIMGDHSKSAINTMFNTGTVVGVSANIFGSGFPRNFIPSFSWGGAQGFSIYKLSEVYNVASKVFSRRNVVFDEIEQKILLEVYNMTKRYRNES